MGSHWTLMVAAFVLAVFFSCFFVASSFSPDARLVPRLLCAGGVVVAGWLLATEIREWRRTGAKSVRWTPDVGVALKTFGWMAAFLLLVALGGYLAAVLISYAVFRL